MSFLQAIVVKQLPPTETKGKRWKADSSKHSITLPEDYSLDNEGNAKKAAKELMKLNNWQLKATGGVLPNGDYVFVLEEFLTQE